MAKSKKKACRGKIVMRSKGKTYKCHVKKGHMFCCNANLPKPVKAGTKRRGKRAGKRGFAKSAKGMSAWAAKPKAMREYGPAPMREYGPTKREYGQSTGIKGGGGLLARLRAGRPRRHSVKR